MRTNFFFITSNLSNSPTYLVTLSFSQATCLLVYLSTCPLTMLLCLWYKQLVYSSTCSLVYLLCLWYNQLVHPSTRSLVNSSTYLVTLSFLQAPCLLVNPFTCLL